MIFPPSDVLSQYRCPRLTMHAFILFCHFGSKNLTTFAVCMHSLKWICIDSERHYFFIFIDTCLKRELFKKRKLIRFRLYLIIWPCVKICALSSDSGRRCHVKLKTWPQNSFFYTGSCMKSHFI